MTFVTADKLLNERRNRYKKFHFVITGRIEGIESEILETLQNTITELSLGCPYLKFKRSRVFLKEDFKD